LVTVSPCFNTLWNFEDCKGEQAAMMRDDEGAPEDTKNDEGTRAILLIWGNSFFGVLDKHD
jgi:hypothetical protein